MKRLLLVITLGVSGCANPQSLSLLPDSSTLLSAEGAATLARPCSRESPEAEGFWTPTSAEIAQLEADLGKLLGQRSEVCCVLGTGLSAQEIEVSYRQYAGLVVEGQRLIYVNAFPASDANGGFPLNWRSEPVYICDGGPSYWGVLYDPARRRFVQLAFNGFA